MCLMYYRKESQDPTAQYSAWPIEGTRYVYFLKGGMDRQVSE